ncbi:hypothetical protein pb186bvf_005726 [Paramecium bursaria]
MLQHRGKSQPPKPSNQLQQYNNQQPFTMFQEFDQIAGRMMQHMDNQLANMGFGFMKSFDDMENEMFGFSKLHNQVANMPMSSIQQNARDGAFQVYSSSYVSSSKMGPDGRVIKEKYFDNNAIARGMNGHTISERQQGYKNTDGIDRFAHERMMNDKGRKYVKERDRTGQISTTNNYYNIDENQVEQFENEWLGMGQNLRLPSRQQVGYKPIGARDGNQLPFPKPQDTPIYNKRQSDLQPIMLGGGRQQALPLSQSQIPLNRPAIEQQGIQQRQPQRQPIVANRNAELTGVYSNKFGGGRNGYPQAG